MPIPVPASASSMFGASLRALRGEHLRDRLGHCPLALARLGPARERVKLRSRSCRIDADRQRRRPFAPTSSHCSSRANSIRSPRSGRSSRAPINGAQLQPSRWSVAFDGPRALALAPVRIGEHREQPPGNCLERSRRVRVARWRLKADRPAQSRRRRHREPRRMDEREQLEQVEPD